jgi:hypothetical protein
MLNEEQRRGHDIIEEKLLAIIDSEFSLPKGEKGLTNLLFDR